MFSRRTSWNLAANRLTRALNEHRRADKPLLDLSESNPTRAGFSYDGNAILRALLHSRSLQYAPEPRGLLAAREAVAAYYRDACSTAVDPAHIILTTSTSEAYSFLFRLLCDPGDEVLVPTPSYPLFDFIAGLDDVRLVPYPLLYDDRWQIDLHALEQAITPRARAILVVHPNNPTGSLVSAAERARLLELCAAHDLALVADEVFLDYVFDGTAPTFAAGGSALAFALSGLSKIAGLPQMKAAWLVAYGPPDLRDAALARLEVIADTFLSLNTPIQLALPALLALRQKIGGQILARVLANLAELDRQLTAQQLCQRLRVEAGWYAILRVPAHGANEDLAIALLEAQGVLVQPGYFYDFHQEGFLVLSLITPMKEFREGVQRVLSHIARR